MMKHPYFYPLLFAVYPVLFLYSHNFGQVSFGEISGALVIALGTACLLLISAGALLRNWHKAALVVALAVFLFFSYGHFYEELDHLHIFGFEFFRHRFMGPFWTLVFAFGTTAIMVSRRKFAGVTIVLNAIALSLMMFLFCAMGTRSLKHGPIPTMASGSESAIDTLNSFIVNNGDTLAYRPDIYYLILDGYASNVTLKAIYNYDNGAFLADLEKKGFYLPARSRTNYCWTHLSLVSSLNMEYLEGLPGKTKSGTDDLFTTYAMIENNRVQAYLKTRGYRYVHIGGSGYYMTEANKNSDSSFSPRGYNEYERILLRTTVLRIFEEHFTGKDWQRKINYSLHALLEVPKIKGPKFVFIHIKVTHPPFVFDSSGRPLNNISFSENGKKSWGNRSGYTSQITFLNKRLSVIIDTIIRYSVISPVIILQADHGPAFTFTGRSWVNPTKEMVLERTSIFNAYLVPPEVRECLYDSITPVNSFRIIFKCIFKMNMEPLADVSYYSACEEPCRFYRADSLLSGSAWFDSKQRK